MTFAVVADTIKGTRCSTNIRIFFIMPELPCQVIYPSVSINISFRSVICTQPRHRHRRERLIYTEFSFFSCLYLRSPESTNIMHSCECIMFQYKMNIFEAGTYLLLSIEFSAYRIEIHLQQTWTSAHKSLWNSIYWILLDLRWQ